MAKRIVITDRKIKSLIGKAPAAGDKREMLYMDSIVPPLGIRPSGKEYRWAFVGRFGSKNPTRRDMGSLGTISLAEARDKARRWITLIEQGIDPRIEDERIKRAAMQAELRRKADTFAAVAEAYLAGPVSKKRTARDTARLFNKELLPTLGHRPIADITRFEIKQLLTAILERPAVRTSMICFQHLNVLFNWAIEREVYGLENSPTAAIKPATFFPKQKPRTRVLTDEELRAFWRATERLAYPYGPLAQLLLLTGARETELGRASWSEISADRMALTVPSARFKMDAVHTIPLSGQARAILESLPTFSGDYIFTTTGGAKAVNGYGKIKRRLDTLMAEELGHEVAPWVFHDLRRSTRTRLSSLTSFEVAELVLGHARKGMARVYDQHTFEPEMRAALEAWGAKLRSIVNPNTGNVRNFSDRASGMGRP
jgi:integrase